MLAWLTGDSHRAGKDLPDDKIYVRVSPVPILHDDGSLCQTNQPGASRGGVVARVLLGCYGYRIRRVSVTLIPVMP